jgi:hypothetical protein
MKMVICDGAVRDLVGHKCEERKCKHRKLHKPIKGRCGIRNHNNSDGWCTFPGVPSMLDLSDEGTCVTCMTHSEIRKEELKLNAFILKSLEEQKKELKQSIVKNQEALKNISKRIKILKAKK